ncbi:hypothetical protein CHS0354_031714 [Potamilus streckersoni]|uniref:Uncharacterized protein n=1 Tax=Potamilus streckersoni TaxID=2493646 RepID=A0AAE0WAA0_9BIVA|nr:hypothetical protein CHS0354_031714 [Potamilus streckersoni]
MEKQTVQEECALHVRISLSLLCNAYELSRFGRSNCQTNHLPRDSYICKIQRVIYGMDIV